MVYENKVGDVVVIGEDVVPRHRWRLGIVIGLIKGNDGLVRGAKVKIGKTRNILWRLINCLYPTKVRAAEQLHHIIRNVRKTKKKDAGNNNSTEVTRSKSDAAVTGELWQQLNDTDVDPWLVDGGECEIYNYVTFFIIKKRVAFLIIKTIIFVIYNIQSSYDLIEERLVFSLCIF